MSFISQTGLSRWSLVELKPDRAYFNDILLMEYDRTFDNVPINFWLGKSTHILKSVVIGCFGDCGSRLSRKKRKESTDDDIRIGIFADGDDRFV